MGRIRAKCDLWFIAYRLNKLYMEREENDVCVKRRKALFPGEAFVLA